ncbi:MAG: hypothetical protein ACTSU3_06115 [Candidatus Thorarchaeota archaeon]
MTNVLDREKVESVNPMLLRIRNAALDKAFGEIRNHRFKLDDELNRGHITNDEYQKGILGLIMESNDIRNQQKVIGEALNSL